MIIKILKVIAGILLSVILICCSTLALGSFAAERATSEAAIRTAIDKTDVIPVLMNEVLKENTVNMGGVYGSAAKAIMDTDPMKDFVAAYMAASISSQIYGRDVEEIANDELMVAFAQGVDIAAEEKGFRLTTKENEEIREAMLETIPALTAKLNDALDRYETTALNEEMQQRTKDLHNIVSPGFRYGSLATALLAAILLIMLFWRSRMGFMWAAVGVLLASCFYVVVALVSNSFAGQSGTFVEPVKRMLYVMCEYGSTRIAMVGGGIGILLIILCCIARALRRER